jgi:hyperosmotically inducible protein
MGAFVGAAAVALMAVACSSTDPGVTTAVKAKMASDDQVKAYRIDVDTKDGVVTLAGNVDTAAAKARAVQLASSTDGVVRVVDQLTVAPGAAATTGVGEATRDTGDAAKRAGSETAQSAGDATRRAGDAASGAAAKAGDAISDAAVTTAVKSKFLADDRISGLKINVDTKNNIVTLTGQVATAAEKTHALDVARKTEGVKSVVDKLTIRQR